LVVSEIETKESIIFWLSTSTAQASATPQLIEIVHDGAPFF
jgi:hypothetical protein